MGAVRIYKATNSETGTVWQVRSNGCTKTRSIECGFGGQHKGYCNGFTDYAYLLKHLNDPTSELGAYLKK